MLAYVSLALGASGFKGLLVLGASMLGVEPALVGGLGVWLGGCARAARRWGFRRGGACPWPLCAPGSCVRWVSGPPLEVYGAGQGKWV